MSVIDQAKSIREGEELDANVIDQWLKSQVDGLQGEPTIKQFPGGSSNLTYLISYDNRELILRRQSISPTKHEPDAIHDSMLRSP